jgi:hypothetical protein
MRINIAGAWDTAWRSQVLAVGDAPEVGRPASPKTANNGAPDGYQTYPQGHRFTALQPLEALGPWIRHDRNRSIRDT